MVWVEIEFTMSHFLGDSFFMKNLRDENV